MYLWQITRQTWGFDEQPWQFLGWLMFIKDYFPNIKEEEVIFNTIPIFIWFGGLELEHYKMTTIENIASAMGKVKSIIPSSIAKNS